MTHLKNILWSTFDIIIEIKMVSKRPNKLIIAMTHNLIQQCIMIKIRLSTDESNFVELTTLLCLQWFIVIFACYVINLAIENKYFKSNNECRCIQAIT